MNDVYEQIKFFANSIWERRSYALAVAWFVCLAGWFVVATMPNNYKSSGRIFVDTSNVLRPLLKGLAVETDLQAELELMRRTLTSRANLMKVARLTDLDLGASTPYEMNSLLQSLKSRIQIKPDGRNLLAISFVDSDPVRARNVTGALITTYIEMNLGRNREDIESAQQFLGNQIFKYEQKLRGAEEQLSTFKKDKLSTLPDQGNAQRRIQTLGNERLEAESVLRRATSRRDLLRQQLETPESAFRDPQLEELEVELRDLLSRFTEQHPEVLTLRRKLRALRGARESERPAEPGQALAATSQAPGSVDEPYLRNAAIGRVKIDLAQQETDIAFYRGRIARIKNRIGELESAVARIPEVEAEQTRLNRDYEELISKYKDLVDRREKANISRERDTRNHDIKFRVLDPPRVPDLPTGPSRSLLLVVSLVGGIGAGVAFALLLGHFSDAVSDPEQLRRSFGLPILGIVSTMDNFKNHSLRVAQSSGFFAGVAMLFVVFAGLVMVERQSGLSNLGSNEHVNAAYKGVGEASGKLRSVIAKLIERI